MNKKSTKKVSLKDMPFSQRVSEIRNGRIDKDYLSNLIMTYKFKKSIDPNYPVSDELGLFCLTIIEKTLGGYRWRGYSDDWKEEFRGKALEHVIKYLHNYDPVKLMEKSKNKDPYYYIGRIVSNACIQSWRKCSVYSKHTIPLNDDILYQYDNSVMPSASIKASNWNSDENS